MAEMEAPVERIPQSPRPEENMRVLPAQPNVAPTEPMPVTPPQPQAVEQLDMDQVSQIVKIALSQEFLQGFPQNVAVEVQRLAKSINMILLREDIPLEEKNRVLNELLPELLKLMEAREGVQQSGA